MTFESKRQAANTRTYRPGGPLICRQIPAAGARRLAVCREIRDFLGAFGGWLEPAEEAALEAAFDRQVAGLLGEADQHLVVRDSRAAGGLPLGVVAAEVRE